MAQLLTKVVIKEHSKTETLQRRKKLFHYANEGVYICSCYIYSRNKLYSVSRPYYIRSSFDFVLARLREGNGKVGL